MFGLGYPYRRSVIVNTQSGRAFRGVLWNQQGAYLVLRNAEISRPGVEWAPLDGEVVIDRANVDFLQVLAAKGVPS